MNFYKINKIKVLAQNLVVALVSIVLFFLFAEACLTITGFNSTPSLNNKVDLGRLFYNNKYEPKKPKRCETDPWLFWRLIPKKGDIDSEGFRSKKEYSTNKEEGIKRIICLGDSVTYGVWVKTEETYPYILEKMLNANSGSARFEVINAGVMGYTSLQGLRQLKRDLLKYKPDLITVCFGFDDNFPAVIYSDKEQKTYNKYIFYLQNMLRNSKFYRLLEISLRRMGKRLVLGKNDFSREASISTKKRVEPEDYRRNLQEMSGIAKENNFNIIFIKPVFFRLKYKEMDYLRNYADMIPKEQALGLVDELRKLQGKTDLFLDACHFTPSGHWVVAKTIYDTLVKKKIVNPQQDTLNIPMPVYSNVSLPEGIKEANLQNCIKMGENEIGALTFGWLDLEKIGGRYVRFVGGYNANAYLKDSSPEEKNKGLRIEVFSYIPNRVSIFVNDNYLAAFECLPNTWQEADFNFHNDTKFLKVSICPERIFKPSVEFKSRDNRTLSVAISKIEIVKGYSLNRTP